MKIIQVNPDSVIFDDGSVLTSEHNGAQSQEHRLAFNTLVIEDLVDKEFDLSTDAFFDKIEGFGLHLRTTSDELFDLWAYAADLVYSEDFKLVVTNGESVVRYDITGCEDVIFKPIE